MKLRPAQIGICDDSFALMTVQELIAENVLEKPLDGNHGEIHPKTEDFVAEGVPFVMATDVNNGGIDYDTCNFISVKQADSLRKGFAKNGDVLLTHKATIGRTAIVRYEKHPYIMLTPQVTYYRVKDQERLDHRFLRYYFDSELFQKTLRLWAESGSTRAYLGITEQQKLPVIVPPIAKQRKIASILSPYDDLIENNKHRITLLEKLTEEIYREWFVRLRFPDYEKVGMVKGVPRGWNVLPFAEVVNINPRERLDKSEEDVPYVGMEDLSVKSLFFKSKGVRQGGQGSKFKNRDVLFPRITPSVENGKRGFVTSLRDGQVGLGSTEFIVFREKEISAEHIYFLTCSADFRKHAELSMTGASGRQRVQEECFSFFLVKTPPADIRKRFSDLVQPHVSQIHLLSEQIDRLTRSRDLLLPRLISGKLSVANLDVELPLGLMAEFCQDSDPTSHA